MAMPVSLFRHDPLYFHKPKLSCGSGFGCCLDWVSSVLSSLLKIDSRFFLKYGFDGQRGSIKVC